MELEFKATISDESVAHGFNNGLRFRVYLELFVDASHVKTYCVDAASQFSCQRLVAVSINQQFQQPNFVRGEMVCGSFWRTDLPKHLNDPGGDFG